MKRSFALLLALAACHSGRSVGIDVAADCIPSAARLTVTATTTPDAAISAQIDDVAGFLSGAHRVVVLPPDDATTLTVTLEAFDMLGGSLGRASVATPLGGAGRIAR